MASKILLVQSSENRRRMLRLLEDKNLEISIASGLLEAQQKLGTLPSYDLLLVDSELPDGSWRELLEFVLDSHLNCEVIVCSRFLDEQLWAESLACGAFDLIVEPYERQEVQRIIENAIESQYLRRFSRRAEKTS